MIIHKQPTRAQKVTICCGITNERIIGPYFFEDGNELTATVTGHKYRNMIIKEYLLPQIQDLDMQNFWFQQESNGTYGKGNHDITTAFPGRLISLFGDVRGHHDRLI